MSGSWDTIVRIWDLDDIIAKSIVLEGHSSLVNSVAIQDNKVVSGSCDQTVRIWDLEDSKAEPVVLDGHSDYVNSIAIQGSAVVLGQVTKLYEFGIWMI